MRRIIAIIISVILGAVLTVPTCHAEFVEPENSFCIYGVSGMQFTISIGVGIGSSQINYKFPNGSSHFENPYVITSEQISEWYANGIKIIQITCPNASAITLTNPDAIISDTNTITISSDDGTPLGLVTQLFALKRMYLFPIGSAPNVAGVTPTPFVNDGSDIVVDDNELNNTIGAVNQFQPFMQFIFTSVIPWAGFAGLIILVFATIRFMLKG